MSDQRHCIDCKAATGYRCPRHQVVELPAYEMLEIENQQLRADLAAMTERAENAEYRCSQWAENSISTGMYDEMTSERDRYREALERISNGSVEEVMEFARAAFSPKPEGESK